MERRMICRVFKDLGNKKQMRIAPVAKRRKPIESNIEARTICFLFEDMSSCL